MDPISIIGVVSGVAGITDIIARSLTGLVTPQALYKSADMLVAVIIGYLHTVKHALEEIKIWVDNIEDLVESASILAKIEHAVQCFGVPLGTLLENIEGLQRHVNAGTLTPRGKLSFMLGQEEVKTMSMHLGNQVQAVNLLMTMAQCNTRQNRKEILEDKETHSVFRQIQDDSSLYLNGDTISLRTLRSGATEQTNLLDSTFSFDEICFDSEVYRNAFRTMVEGQRRRRANAAELSQNTSNDQADPLTGTAPAGPVHTLVRSSSNESVDTVKHVAQLVKLPERSTAAPIPAKVDGAQAGVVTVTAQMPNKELRGHHTTADSKQDTIQPPDYTLKPWKNRQSISTRLFLGTEVRSRKAAARRGVREAEKDVKMLLLGSCMSGKSTWLKQLKLSYEGPYTVEERESFKEIVFTHVVQSMRIILEAIFSLRLPWSSWELVPDVQTVFWQPTTITDDSLPTDVGLAVRRLRDEIEVQQAITRSREFHLPSCAQYYFDSIERISQIDYLPSDKDILYSTSRTTGVTETSFSVGELTYRVIDVGGTSAYDQILFEDETSNRMQEDLKVFDSVCNSRWLANTTIVLFLNKIDLFRDKLLRSPMKNHFPDFEGGSNYGTACDYILNRFVELNQDETKQIHTHFTCALDTA